MSKNIRWHYGSVTEEKRFQALGQKGAVVWFTGLSGSGKSSVAHEVEAQIIARGLNGVVLDGDNIRHGLNSDLGFSPRDREENIRRIGEVANLFCRANVITLSAFISPYRADRDRARALAPAGQFFEIYCSAAVDVCEQRDPKGLYKKARAGLIADFTGISAPYEAPLHPELILSTTNESIVESATLVIKLLQDKDILPRSKKVSLA